MKHVKKLFVLAFVVASLAMGVAGCQKAQTPEQKEPASTVKSAETPKAAAGTAATTGTAAKATPAAPAAGAKATTGTATH